MLRFKLTFDKVEFDPKLAQPAIDAWMRYEITEAGRVFFQNALPLIHIDTGMSIASFTNLARFLNEPLDYMVKSATIPRGYHPPGTSIVMDKGPASGMLLSAKTSDIISQKADGRFVFRYWTEVWHFMLWDTVGLADDVVGSGMPWGAFEAGREAALQYLATSNTRMPPLNYLMALTEVMVLVQDGVKYTTYRKRRAKVSRNLYQALGVRRKK